MSTRSLTTDITDAFAALSKSPGERDGEHKQYIGSYQIISEIGVGGAARVLRARHIHPNYAERPFALKILHTEGAADPGLRDLFRSEAYLMALLEHPNIGRTFEAGVDDGKLFIAMEYISGCDLWELLERASSLGVSIPEEVLLHIIGEVLRGLSFAHSLRDGDGNPLNVIHHDVNPTNVFLSFNGDVKLGDFGVAAITADGEDATEALGKMGYFAPEQFTGARLDQRVDLFAFGVMMFELLCGVAPFDASDPDEAVRLNSQAIVPPPRRVQPDLDAGLESIILRALRRDPKERYRSAQMMLAALEGYLPNRSGMSLAVASYMRALLLPEYIQELKMRQGLAGRDGKAGVGNRVALVCAEPDRCGRWQAVLRERRFTCTELATAADLGEMLERGETPDVVVADVSPWNFPVESLTRVLAGTGRVLPVVATAERAASEHVAKARQLGALDFAFEPLAGDRVQTALWMAVTTGRVESMSGRDTAQTTSRRMVRVLLVSADARLAEKLRGALEQWCYAVDVVSSIGAALARTHEATYQAVIYDAFPEVTDRCRSFPEQFRACEGMGMVPIVFLAAPDDQGALTGVTRSAVRYRDDAPVAMATILSQLCADNSKGRSFVRYEARFCVEMRYSGRSFDAETVDISRGGVMLRCEEIPPVGTDVQLLMSIPDSDIQVEVPGRVVRVNLPKDPSARPGVGIEFVGFGVRNESQLIGFLHELAAQATA